LSFLKKINLKIYQSIYDFTPAKKTVLTLGTFDGVHKGHHKIISELVDTARKKGCESLILTFFPHPRMVLQDPSEIKLLNTIQEKSELLAHLGVDNLIIHPFDQTFSRLSAEEFVTDILVKQLALEKIIIGYDHRFGRNRTADINDLMEYGEELGFEVQQISALEIDSISVSSTKIRTALQEGDVEKANDYLGYPYFLSGKVVKGKSIGRTIGFPTANLHIEESYKLIPKNGVYVVQTKVNDETVYGMMNIGFNPTFEGATQSIEIHLLDFEGDLYYQHLKIELLKRIRDEVKFDSMEALQDQLVLDKNQTLQYLKL
jgi:riboflavin kinase / FMN adenylyltransferase